MIASRYAARVTVSVAGQQDAGISTYTRLPGDGRPAVVVRTGPTLTYCYDREDVSMRLQAWQAALTRARMVFEGRPETQERLASGLAAQLVAQRFDSWDVTGYMAAATPDGRPLVLVRTGALTVACLDAAAVASLAAAWEDADLVAAVLWPDGPEE